MASGGYPGSYTKGKLISGLDEAARMPNIKVFHAGTSRNDDQTVTSGGRVLGVTALGADLWKARAAAYEAVEKIKFDGAHYRRDIGVKAFR
jgi:phosphoribosylamine--glycine ligase